MATCPQGPEYNTLQKCYPQLVDLIAESPNTIGDQLFARSALSNEDLNYLRSSASEQDKARRIVDRVRNRVLHYPLNYEVFVQVLKSEGEWTKDVVHSLETTYMHEKEKETPSDTTPTNTTTSHPTGASRSDFGSDDTVKSVYEYADSELLIAEGQETKSEDDLKYETDRILCKFAGLIVQLVDCLKRCNVKVKNLVFFLGQVMATEPVLITDKRSGSLVDEKYLDDMVRDCKTIEQIFNKIKYYYSWFNHLLIEEIVERFCSKDAEFQLAYGEYKQMFKTYCNNRLCRVPRGQNTFGNSRHRTRTVVFKIEQNWSTVQISQVSVIKTLICELFHLRKEALFLRSVRKGCVELLFDVPDFVAELILPLSPETEEAIHKAGILEVYPISASTKGSIQSDLKPGAIVPIKEGIEMDPFPGYYLQYGPHINNIIQGSR